ncbi:MAG: Eco57I restriction-modification methylase domain-containing protein, partial [Roseinatronobacter sp.]
LLRERFKVAASRADLLIFFYEQSVNLLREGGTLTFITSNKYYRAAYGATPNAVAALAYDGIAAVGALASRGGEAPFSAASLTQVSGFAGVTGVFRLRADGSNERGLAIAEIRNQRVSVLSSAPRSFAGGGS